MPSKNVLAKCDFFWEKCYSDLHPNQQKRYPSCTEYQNGEQNVSETPNFASLVIYCSRWSKFFTNKSLDIEVAQTTANYTKKIPVRKGFGAQNCSKTMLFPIFQYFQDVFWPKRV